MGILYMSNIYFDDELQHKLDRFALDLVKGYRRYIAGEGSPTEESTKLFGCAVFAHYLAKCVHTQKKLKEKGIPSDETCDKERYHFFLCSGSVYCGGLAENLIRCARKSNVSSVDELRDQCSAVYDSFRECYLNQLENNYNTKKE